MQINISDRGALLWALVAAAGGVVIFAPDMVAGVFDSLASMLGTVVIG